MVDLVYARPRLTVAIALLLSFIGVAAWFLMPREEDPQLSPRFGLVVAAYPGADAETVERLVAEPLEEELSEVESVKTIESTIRSGVVVTSVELRDDVTAFSESWADVQDALDDATAAFPPDVLSPTLNRHLNETEGVVYAVTGSDDPLVLSDAADALRDRMLSESDVARVQIAGDPQEQITVEWTEAHRETYGLTVAQLAGMLRGRNVTTPAGSIEVDARALDIRPHADFRTVAEIESTPVILPDGTGVRLGDITSVRAMAADPSPERARYQGDAAVLVGVVPRAGLDVVTFGKRLRVVADDYRAEHPDVVLTEVAFQPDQVEARLDGLSSSLLLGIGIVAIVLIVTMGIRLGLVVALAVPLVTFAAVALYAAGGGVLHQIAIAALVIALGLLVDNAIVVAEAIQRRLDEGVERKAAVRASVRELAIPLASATVTTFASFVPMLLSEGSSADFTRAIPLVVILTLGASYFYALVVTPLLAGRVLAPRPRTGATWLTRLATSIGSFSGRRPWLTLVLASLVLVPEVIAAQNVSFSFFPSSDRAQMVVQIEMPEGTRLGETDAVATRIEEALLQDDEVNAVTTVVGRGAPQFYYNLSRSPSSPHVAEIIVSADDADAVGRIADRVRALASTAAPDALVLPRRLEQGPPVDAPVEIRLRGDDLAQLAAAAETVRGVLRDTAGTRDVRTNGGLGVPVLNLEVDDAHAARFGFDRQGLSLAVLSQTRGIPAGTFRGGDDPVPVLVRGAQGPRTDWEALSSKTVGAAPLLEVSRASVDMKPAVIRHRDRTRVMSVLAEVQPGTTYATVLDDAMPALEALDLEGVDWELGGSAESSGDANGGIGAKAPIGFFLLIAVLLAEFNSFRRVGIVLATAPLAAMGIWPGLALAGLPFGFVALLGAIALIGIVVNAAIVLIDLADRRRAEGVPVVDAVRDAVALRARPILLTTLTTVAGLLPLGFSSSTLWPPMAWAMISGLLIATVLSLFVVPALYRVLVRDLPSKETSP
ncbi:MAG: efflux RND transporter permease subunit [Myxococcota bacterium]